MIGRASFLFSGEVLSLTLVLLLPAGLSVEFNIALFHTGDLYMGLGLIARSVKTLNRHFMTLAKALLSESCIGKLLSSYGTFIIRKTIDLFEMKE